MYEALAKKEIMHKRKKGFIEAGKDRQIGRMFCGQKNL
jgi:hypothetical protein